MLEPAPNKWKNKCLHYFPDFLVVFLSKRLLQTHLMLLKKNSWSRVVSLIRWRDSILTFVRTHSKVTITMLTRIGVHPTYNQIKSFLKLKSQFNLARRHGKMQDPRDPGSRKFLNNCGNFFHELNKMVVFNINKTSFMLKMMK